MESKAILTISFLFLAVLSTPASSLQWPARPLDLLPELPRKASWSILKQFKSPVGFFPKFEGYATSGGNFLEWEGSCFKENRAWLEFHNKSGSELGGATLHLQISKPKSLLCTDVYVFATAYRVMPDYYFTRGHKTIDFYQWENKEEYEYVRSRGVSIFLFEASFLGTMRKLLKFLPLYSNDERGEEANIEFLKTNMGAKFELRPESSWVAKINPDDINSGDCIAVSRIRGRSGAFHTLQKWVIGTFAGHFAIFIRDPEGKLWVAESGREDEQGNEIIEVLPWEDWWEYEWGNDTGVPHIAILPLHPDLRARFDAAAAWKYATSVNGDPYGSQNMIFSWIDTVNQNYPEPLTPELVATAMTIWGIVRPGHGVDYWNEALNMRLGTQNLTVSEVLVEVERRGSTFGELLSIPEQDDWVYKDGKSTVCVAFALNVLKHAGMFGSTADSIQTTEFTVRDGYMLKFYEDNIDRLPKWCNEGDDVKLPFCQVLGKYRMELPGYNTLEPYPHMNERCPSLPPDYERPSDC